MTNREIENKIKTAFQSAVPDVFEKVICECENKPQVPQVFKKRKFNVINIRKIISIAAAIVIVITAGAVGFIAANTKTVDSVISFDVNPSIELDINKNERILKAVALNEEAEVVLSGMKLEGSDISVAVNAVIGSMLRNGYIDELANSILISVDNKDEKKSEELKERLSKVVSELLNTDNFEGAVISQTIKKEEKIISLAEKYGITVGKAQLIQQIVESDSKYEFKDLVSLSINELNLILTGKKISGNVASNGKASEKQYIGKQKAKKIALSQANVSEKDITEYDCKLDCKDGVMIYEVKFKTQLKTFEYNIVAKSGKVIKSEVEQNSEDTQENVTYIGEEKVKETVLLRTGASEEDITDYECELQKDGSTAEYKISFVEGNVVYVYEVDAVSGNITSEEREKIKESSLYNNQSDGEAEYIGETKAKKIAAANVGLKVTEIADVNCSLENQDGVAVYVIDFSNDSGNKYYFEINAKTGKIIDSKKTIAENDNTDSQTQPTESEISEVTYIGKSKAKEIVVKNVGAKISEIQDLKCEFNEKNQPLAYEISFVYGNIKYTYKVDAVTGEILDVAKSNSGSDNSEESNSGTSGTANVQSEN